MSKCCHNNGYFCPMCDDWVDPSQVLPSLKEKIEAIEWSEVEKTIPDYNPDLDRECGADFMQRYVLSLISKMQEEEK